MDQDEYLVAHWRAHEQQNELHSSISVQQALDTVWEQFSSGLLSIEEWVAQLASLPAL